MACTSGRNVHGIVLLDKRLGVSSNRALQEVRRLFNANKAGHTGSLDPLATGLLPLCFGEATKVSGLLLDSHKRYQVVIQLGVVTDTGDLEGQVIATQVVPELDHNTIHTCLQHFTGTLEQVPPMYSALKHQGKKLYELARAGVVVERKARQVTLFDLKLLAWTEVQLTLEVFCSKGTYIRSLAESIGDYLGCGGTVSALRRLQAGAFHLKDAFTLEQLADMNEAALFSCLRQLDEPLADMPAVHLSDEQTIRINYGQSISWHGEATETVRMYSPTTFLGLGEILLDGKLAPTRLFNLSANL